MNTPSPEPARVGRRLVYYLAGFDTRSARSYHQLYQTEAKLQQAVNACEYEVSDPDADGPHAVTWRVTARHADGAQVETRYSFLQWNDIVREHWPASSARVAASVPSVYWKLWLNGAIGKTWQLSRPFGWMLVLPLLYCAVGLVAAAAAAFGGAALAARWAPGGGIAAMALAGAAAGALVAQGALVATERSRVFWLMRAWKFMLYWGREGSDPLQARWEAFAQKIETDLQAGPVDEALIVGHSAGAMVAIAVAERWLALDRQGRPPSEKVKLVTLGNATPILGLIPEAAWFRRQIAVVGASDMPWIDFTAPSDPLCYALVNPFTACGLPVPSRSSYRVKSARFDRMFRPEDYALVRRDYFRIHFQYLMSTWQPVENDYFRLTAGPHALVVDASAG